MHPSLKPLAALGALLALLAVSIRDAALWLWRKLRK